LLIHGGDYMKKRPDGRYQKAITIDGKKQFFYGKTQAEVNKKILAYEKKKEQGRTFEEVAEEWKSPYYQSLAYGSLRSVEPAVKRAIKEFQDKPIKSITARDVNYFVSDFARAGYAQKTVAMQLQVVRQILGYAVNCDDIQYNVATSVSIPKNLPKSKRDVPLPETIEKIKNGINLTFGLFGLFALYTGCRRGEILALQYKDIDFNEKQINITKSVYYVGNQSHIKEPKTAAGVRKITLIPQLEANIPKMNEKDYIFNFDGKLMTKRKFETLWERYCLEIGENITPHQLRHAYATRLYELGIDEKSAQGLLGHADITTTKNVYTHISEQKRKVTAEILKDF